MKSLNIAGIGPHALFDMMQNVALIASSQRRIRIGHFASYLWRGVARQFTPTPRELKVEINPNLRTRYTRENRTFVVTLTLAPRGEDLAPQFVFGGGAEGHGQAHGAGGGYVELIDEKRALKSEMEAEKQLMAETKEHMKEIQKADELLQMEGKTREIESEKRVDDQLMLKQEQKLDAMKTMYKTIEETEKIITHEPTQMEMSAAPLVEDTRTDGLLEKQVETKVEGRHEERVETGAVAMHTTDKRIAEPVDAAVEEFVEQTEKKEDIAELRLFNEILRNDITSQYHVRISKNPEILSAAEEGGGDQIVLEVWTNSFTDTQRINANMRPIFRP